MSIEDRIKELESTGDFNPNCETCQVHFYPAVKSGDSITSVFAPRHKASDKCKSGKYNHCSCDICF